VTFDTHCHLTHARFESDRAAAIARAREAGLLGCVTIGTGVDDARKALGLARHHAGFVHCTAGLDPFSAHRAGAAFDEELAALRALLRGGGFVALGEVGLDFHYDLQPREVQARQLTQQLDLAAELDLPVVIHVREAHAELAALLGERRGARGVIHSFTAGPAEAKCYLELGWHLAFNGVLTFKNAEEVRQAARSTPLDRLLVETDSPYLAPVPHRGKRCEPAMVLRTLERLAELHEQPLEQVAAATAENARRLFRLS
jgi:TatD DNase family protein